MEKCLEGPTGSESAINSSNIGFKLLKKHGWKEGTGLGVSEQGRLEPIEAHLKNNKRGIGAEKGDLKPTPKKPVIVKPMKETNPKKPKLTKKMRKVLAFEKMLDEKELERVFMRDFWPENV